MINIDVKKLFVAGALIALPFFALGETSATPNARKALNQELQQKQQVLQQEAKQKREVLMRETKAKRETFKDEALKRVEALKKKVGEERAKRIDQFFNQMVKKFENAIDRLNGLADRIESRLNKSETAGNDVSKIREQLKSARDKISAAQTALNDAKTKFKEMANSQNPKEAFKQVKVLVQGVAQKVKDAHRALVDVVNSIKGLRLGDKATSTSSTNN